MRESIRRIQQDGYSTPLQELVKGLRIQKVIADCIGDENEHAYVTPFRHNGLCWYYEGIVKESASVLLELSREGVTEVNANARELLRVNGEEVSGIEHAQVLDLNDDGERWEGDVLHNQPYGWGVLFNADGEKVYEGFRLKDVSVCYGRSYYPDIQRVEYEGEIYDGRRWRRGTHYDRKGNRVFDGEWMNNETKMARRVILNGEKLLLHNHIKELVVMENGWKGREWRVLDLSFMPRLRLLEVGDKCFEYVDDVRLIKLNRLESVMIGERCFTKHKNDWSYDANRCFQMKNCERLRELKTGRYSFSYYDVCEIENVTSLEVIEMGELSDVSCIFEYGSLELKSEWDGMK